jgi:hypothetical protein
MGMYTELFISTRIKNDPIAVKTIKAMFGDEDISGLPVHPLFSCPRWRSMLVCSSYYFVPRSTHLFEFDNIGQCWVLISRSDFKNYDGEIGKFIDWIEPYLDVSIGEMIGYYRYEEVAQPTIIYAGGKPSDEIQ